HLAGTDEEDGPAAEPRENLLRELDGRERDRHRMAGDLRLAPDLLGDGERLGEERVQHRPDRLARLGEGKRVLHLAQDLRLADHRTSTTRPKAGAGPRRTRLYVEVRRRPRTKYGDVHRRAISRSHAFQAGRAPRSA